ASATTVVDAGPPFPSSVNDLATLVPAGAGFVVEGPMVTKIGAFLPPAQRDAFARDLRELESKLGERLRVPGDLVATTVDALERPTSFGDRENVTVVARFSSRAPIDALLSSDGFETVAGDAPAADRRLVRPRAAGSWRIAWHGASAVLIVGQTDDAI